MAHNIDNRTQRERRHRRAYMKSLRRLDAFDKNGGKKDSPERFQIWLKGWRAKHPAEARSVEALAQVYAVETAPAPPRPPKKVKVKKPKETKEPAEGKKSAEPKAEKKEKSDKKAEKPEKKAKSQ
jgi:hypothetical protein